MSNHCGFEDEETGEFQVQMCVLEKEFEDAMKQAENLMDDFREREVLSDIDFNQMCKVLNNFSNQYNA